MQCDHPLIYVGSEVAERGRDPPRCSTQHRARVLGCPSRLRGGHHSRRDARIHGDRPRRGIRGASLPASGGVRHAWRHRRHGQRRSRRRYRRDAARAPEQLLSVIGAGGRGVHHRYLPGHGSRGRALHRRTLQLAPSRCSWVPCRGARPVGRDRHHRGCQVRAGTAADDEHLRDLQTPTGCGRAPIRPDGVQRPDVGGHLRHAMDGDEQLRVLRVLRPTTARHAPCREDRGGHERVLANSTGSRRSLGDHELGWFEFRAPLPVEVPGLAQRVQRRPDPPAGDETLRESDENVGGRAPGKPGSHRGTSRSRISSSAATPSEHEDPRCGRRRPSHR